MEIGSEYSYRNLKKGAGLHLFSNLFDGAYVFSGRTAIETVLKNEPEIKTAFLPSYCCDSIIVPFQKAGIEVFFYSVKFERKMEISFKIPEEIDCVLWCNYFGFVNDMPDMQAFIEKGGIIIEDITHSLFSKKKYHEQSHYLVASVRKWEPLLCGGYCVSLKGKLTNIPKQTPPLDFLENKMKAIQMKDRYLSGDAYVSKETYLNMFAESNKWLAKNYCGLAMDVFSKEYLNHICEEDEIKIRRNNARIIYEGLENHPNIQFMFPLNEMDCPLFVPILIMNGKRDEIRKKLIDNEIFCPVHWPKPNMDCESNLYDTELSLICDQRYNEKDMKRMVDVLNK